MCDAGPSPESTAGLLQKKGVSSSSLARGRILRDINGVAASRSHFDLFAFRPFGVPALKLGINGSVCGRDQHPARFGSPRRLGDSRFEIGGKI